MKISLYIDYLIGSRIGGIPKYVQSIVESLENKGSKFIHIHIKNFETKQKLSFVEETQKVPIQFYVAKIIYIISPKLLLFLRFNYKSNLIWIPVHTAPFIFKKNKCFVLTIHDIAPIEMPQLFSYWTRKIWPLYLKSSIKMANHIIVPSEFTKNALIKHFNKLKLEITVIPHGVKSVSSSKIIKSTSDHFTYLYIGSICYKKGTDILLKAFHKLSKKHNNVRLIIVGRIENLTNISDVTKELQSLDKLKIVQNLSNKELGELYSKSSAVVCPSRYEGFGIPVLEAMLYKKPVICSNIPVFKEVAKTHAFMYQTEDISACMETFELVLNSISDINERIEKAYNYAKGFTWEKSAISHLELFKKLEDKLNV